MRSLVDGQLAAEAESLGRLITRFEVISKKLLQKYNKVNARVKMNLKNVVLKKIIHQQFHVKRIADAALEIYASSATLSRATAG